MMSDIIDMLDKLNYNHMVIAGLIMLAGAFILSFTCKTAWGEWKKRKG